MSDTVRALGRFCLLNPCFILALLLCLLLALSQKTDRPAVLLALDAPTEVIGWVFAPVQQAGEFEYLEVVPIELRQGRTCLAEYPGRIAVYVRTSRFGGVRNLRYADLIRFESFLESPPHYKTPGVIDYREYLWQQGIVQIARLKSPLQVELRGTYRPRSWLRPIFEYTARFEDYCRAQMSPRQVQFLLSLFLGRSKALQNIDTEALKRLGILHIFVVSGSHVSLVLLYLHFFFRRLGAFGRVAALAGVWAYILIVGCAPPVLRSGIMATLLYLLLGSGLGRQFLNGLGLSALLLLAWFPPCLNSSSFQLSYLSLCSIGLFVLPLERPLRIATGGVAAGFSAEVSVGRTPDLRTRRRIRCLLEERLNFAPRRLLIGILPVLGWTVTYLADVSLCSLFVPLLLLPACLFYSNLWVWSQVVSNVIMVPLFGLAVPLCLLLFLTYWIPGASILAWMTARYGDLLMALVERLSAGALIGYVPQPSALETACYLVLFPIAFFLLQGRWRLLTCLSPFALFLVLNLRTFSQPPGRLTVTMLDVGQSESIHLRYPGGQDALIDTGGSLLGSGNTGDFIGQRVVSRYLWHEHCRRLDYVLLTHSHADHSGGYRFIDSAFPVSCLYFGVWDEAYRGHRCKQLRAGDVFQVSGVEHRVLYPGADAEKIGNANNQSLVLLLRYRDFMLLLTGDIEQETEKELGVTVPRVTILKLAHHGGRFSNSRAWLEATSPRLALISAGRKNPFGHPSPHTLQRLSDLGITALCTCRVGTLRIETDGKKWWASRYSSETQGFEPISATNPE
ncbi:MAG: ComEC/Rec2 family competence protein [Acidobacteriota bacterium]